MPLAFCHPMYSIGLPGWLGLASGRHTVTHGGMVTHDNGANQPETPSDGFVSRYLFSTEHKTIGLQYLWLALFSVFLGMAMSLVIRIHLVWPGAHIPLLSAFHDLSGRHATLPLLHGSLMVFLVLTAAPQAGF